MRSKKKANNSAVDAAQDPLAEKILSLTWDGLRKCSDSGSVERGREYLSNVETPVRLSDGSIIATVYGSDEYFTRLRLDENGALQGDCTCPVGYRCKHTVALALVCAKKMKNGEAIERADISSRKWKRALDELDYARENESYEEDDWDDDDAFEDDDLLDDDEQSGCDELTEKNRGKQSHVQQSKSRGDKIGDHVANLSPDSLRELLGELLENVPEVCQYLNHKLEVRKATSADIVRMARSAVREATSGWYDYWEAKKGRCELPDYSLVKEYFSLIAESANGLQPLMELAEELKRKSFSQAERSRDEYGNISSQVSACMDVAAKAVLTSALDPIEKVKWMESIRSKDDYCVLDYMEVETVEAMRTDKNGWSKIADYYLGKDKKVTVVGETGYRGSIHEIAVALERAGREEEAISLMKTEPEDERYQKELVDMLLRLGRRKDAENACRKYLAAMCADDPHRHDRLERLKAMSNEDDDGKTLAVCDLVSFVAYPNVESYKALKQSCEKIKAWKQVRCGVLQYLETGSLPEKDRVWPLPPMPTRLPDCSSSTFPKSAILCELAMAEKRTKDALSWYKKTVASNNRSGWHSYDGGLEWKVADAICGEFPEEAIAIWQEQVKVNLGYAGDGYYTAICNALKNMRPVMKKLGRLAEWQGIIADIQAGYKRRINLMRMLRNLESERDGRIAEWNG